MSSDSYFSQDTSGLLNGSNALNGISEESFQSMFVKTQKAVERFKAEENEGLHNMVSIVRKDEDLDEISSIASAIRNNFNVLVVFGVGGSSLGAQAITGLRFYKNLFTDGLVKIRFMDNVDEHDLSLFVQTLNLKETAFLIISKSGETVETLCQTCFIVDKAKVEGVDIKKSFFFITENTNNSLRNIASSLGCTILDHCSQIGGRFSCFSNVALLPSAVAGCNIKAFRLGAQEELSECLSGENTKFSEGCALMACGFLQHSCNVNVVYVQRLGYFANWHCQLWAESLGKNGMGTTPVRAMGSVDQHSQLQLYLDGPKDKIFTIFAPIEEQSEYYKISSNVPFSTQSEFLKEKSLAKINKALYLGTINSMREAGCPLRIFNLKNAEDSTMGAIMMHFMLEVVIIGYAVGVNPFGQPAVQKGKDETKRYLTTGNI